jgi:hypothetical protein
MPSITALENNSQNVVHCKIKLLSMQYQIIIGILYLPINISKGLILTST